MLSHPMDLQVAVNKVEAVGTGRPLELTLMQRDKAVVFSQPYDSKAANGLANAGRTPAYGSPEAAFSKFCVIDDMSTVYRFERTQLEDGLKLAR